MNRISIMQIIKAGFAAIALLATSCTTLERVEFSSPPQLDSASAATIKFRSKDNFAPIQHSHVIRVDGIAYGKMKADEQFEMSVTEGSHKLRITCHSRNTLDGNNFPVNYNVVDGESTIEFDVVAGSESCYKIGYALANCAVVTEAEPSYCS